MEPENWRRYWVGDKCEVASRLSRGEAGGGYAEAIILLCASLSALAAELWEGTGIDRVRFVEMLVRLGPNANYCTTVSIPLLAQHLESNSMFSEAQQIRAAFVVPKSAFVVTGPDVDRCEKEVLSLCPQLNLKDVRRFSYASILYGEVRSSYAHEYRPGERADSSPMTMLPDQRVSYVNQLHGETTFEMRRVIHFHSEWLGQCAIELAGAVDGLSPNLPLQKPAVWWCDGG